MNSKTLGLTENNQTQNEKISKQKKIILENTKSKSIIIMF